METKDSLSKTPPAWLLAVMSVCIGLLIGTLGVRGSPIWAPIASAALIIVWVCIIAINSRRRRGMTGNVREELAARRRFFRNNARQIIVPMVILLVVLFCIVAAVLILSQRDTSTLWVGVIGGVLAAVVGYAGVLWIRHQASAAMRNQLQPTP